MALKRKPVQDKNIPDYPDSESYTAARRQFLRMIGVAAVGAVGLAGCGSAQGTPVKNADRVPVGGASDTGVQSQTVTPQSTGTPRVEPQMQSQGRPSSSIIPGQPDGGQPGCAIPRVQPQALPPGLPPARPLAQPPGESAAPEVRVEPVTNAKGDVPPARFEPRAQRPGDVAVPVAPQPRVVPQAQELGDVKAPALVPPKAQPQSSADGGTRAPR